MKVVIKLIEPYEEFEWGKEYQADKLKTGYFITNKRVAKLIPFEHAIEVECKYAD